MKTELKMLILPAIFLPMTVSAVKYFNLSFNRMQTYSFKTLTGHIHTSDCCCSYTYISNETSKVCITLTSQHVHVPLLPWECHQHWNSDPHLCKQSIS